MLACRRITPRPALCFLTLALTACGARSGLGFDGSGGATAGQTVGASASTTGAASTTASTGTGSMKKVCYGLVSSGAPIMTTDATSMGPPVSESRPLLVSAEAGTVALLLGEDPLEGPTNIGSIHAAAFQPWGTWPNDLGMTHPVAAQAGPEFRAARALGDGKSGFDLFFVATGFDPVPTLYLTDELHSFQSYGALPPGKPIPAAVGATPLALAPTANGRIVINDAVVSGGQHLAIVHEPDMPPPSIPGEQIIGCGNRPLVAAAIGEPPSPAAGGPYALVARSNSHPDYSCSGLPGAPSKLLVDTVPSSGPPSPKTTLDANYPIAQVELVPRSDGAWLVWRTEVPPGTKPAVGVYARRLDPIGNTVLNTFDVGQDGGYPFAASSIGDELVVATIDATDPSAKSNITLRVFLADGTPDGEAHIAVASLSAPPGGPWFVDTQRISLLGDTDSVLIAWSEHVTEPTAPRRALVERFTCAGPE